ncbi:hypothetical protein EQ718_26640 (plasmid) [Paracoccus versutus]|jgi:hypothetical protein|uniref:Uncharacterized protein n=1 Tax=Paracoccus versutus TaxID=34007 RepID=A0A099FI06_PARVE|nr:MULTISPECIES: hypothetical protein [Paracoccus]WGR63674.1 hypothetical protein E3U26_23810 [Paracoccus ferrooxidans]SFY27503.1 hypothetical protein SAMN04244548_03341 [Paracoccus pantotrophus]KGJ09891.1 hypothetical protein IT40_14565 [Paracoccus versutus]MBT0781802.1 hypothetical protein [Paracoccus sp. pheM1]MCJ1899706.1 hypothetical protein [Paracoccus versutus]
MAKTPLLRATEEPAPATVSGQPKPGPVAASLAERLARARTANEMAIIVGLKPIKGRSGPKIAY